MKEEKQENRLCKKCLPKDMDNSKLADHIRDYVQNLDEDIRVLTEEYERRLDICKDCDKFIEGLCRACGCFVEMRAALKKNQCPYVRW